LDSNTKIKYSVTLAENNIYSSKAIAKKIHLFSPALRFFPKLVKIMIRSGNMAKAGLYKEAEWAHSSFEIFRALESVGISFELSGMENIGSFDGPAVFISNHMSTLETVILPCIIQPVKEVTFVVKQELLNYPYFKYVLGSRNPIIVGRNNPKEDLIHVITEGAEYLKNGRSIIIFPQKTRSSSFQAEQFNSLGVKLAKKTGAYIVPTALVTDAWANGKYLKEMGAVDIKKKVHIAFGKPFKVETAGAKEHQITIDFIKEKLTEWNRKDCIV